VEGRDKDAMDAALGRKVREEIVRKQLTRYSDPAGSG
jgi:hypothetical protein